MCDLLHTVCSTISITAYTIVLCICLCSQRINLKTIFVERVHTGAKFMDVENYLGVTVLVTLNDGSTIYCMGFMVGNTTNTVKGEFEYVITSASCLKQEGISEISICIQGSPYNKTCKYNKGILDDKIFYHPLYDKLPPLGDVALMRMDSVYNGTTYAIATFTPDIMYTYDNRTLNENKTFVMMWSNSLEFKPYEYDGKSIVCQQEQGLVFTLNYARCPCQEKNKKQGDIEKQYWYMFICADFERPTRNKIYNPGALLVFDKTLLGIYSYSFSKEIYPKENPDSKPLVKTAQIHRYSVLYWYVPWIERTIATDINRIVEDIYDEETTVNISFTTPTSDELPTTISSEYFQIDTAYDDLSMQANPCDEATRIADRFRLEILMFSLILTLV